MKTASWILIGLVCMVLMGCQAVVEEVSIQDEPIRWIFDDGPPDYEEGEEHARQE